MSEQTFALFYRVHHELFPPNSRFGNQTVIEQRVSSKIDQDTFEDRWQAIRQACGYMRSRRISIFPDDAGFDPIRDVEFIRSEIRINGRRPSTLARHARQKRVAVNVVPVPIQGPVPKPVQSTLVY